MTQIFYEGKDIAKHIEVRRCILRDCAGGGADSISISFADAEKTWRSWNPKRGDNIIIKTDDYTTGLMYVDGVLQAAGIFEIEAISTPLTAKKPKTKIWRNVKLSEIYSDVARQNGLGIKTYGVQDYSYKAVTQRNETDIALLSRLCLREGYSVKINDGSLIIFNERQFEMLKPTVEITPDDVMMDYEFNLSDELLSTLTVQYSPPFEPLISYTASSKMQGGTLKKTEYLSTIGEAQRFADNYLHSVNKNRITTYLPMKYITKIASGSTVNVKGFTQFDGAYFIEKVIYDTVQSKTVLYARQVLTEY